MAVARTKKLTATDYYLQPDDGKRYELIGGELCEVTSPNRKHQRVSRQLFLEFLPETDRLGAEMYYAPLDVYLTDEDVVQPDILVVLPGRELLLSDRGIEGGPDLVVEILSPSTSNRDKRTKARLYAEAGVREYWLVSPESETIEVLALRDGGYEVHVRAGYDELVTSTVLPGISFPASRAFA